MDLGLSGAAVFINGGTKGMGRAVAELFAQEGARVAISGRDRSRLDETVIKLSEIGSPDSFGIKTDISDKDSILAAFAEIGSRWGELNTLVNMTTGRTTVSHSETIEDVSEETWNDVLNGIIMGTVRSTNAALPLLRKAKWARIVNVSTTMARLVSPGSSSYSTAKAGVSAYSKSAAWALAKENILVNTVTPGAFNSPAITEYITEKGGYDPHDLSEVARWWVDLTGETKQIGILKRFAEPAEIAPQIVMLGSPINTFIVGANIAVDGGTDWSTP